MAALLALPVALYVGTGPAHPAREHRPVIFIGLDGADWDLLDRLIADGELPSLAALVREGRAGVLSTLHPPISPLIWTTMMTGRSPLEHGILDFSRFNPRTGTREPITSDERRVPAIWDMATQEGKSVAALGFWATYPAEAVRGLIVSDRLFSFQHKESSPPPGIVFPAAREGWARHALDRAEVEIGLTPLKEYFPWLEEDEYEQVVARPDPYAHPVSALRRILVETRVYHDLAIDWLAREKPDIALVYLQGTDTIGHVFAPYAPPRMEGISPSDFKRYSGVPAIYFRQVDRLLQQYREMAERSGAVLMIASDHGFHWRDGRPAERSSLARATAGKWHRDEGIYLLWGPGIAPALGRAPSGGVQQVCPTLLALLGLPADEGGSVAPLPGVEPVARGPVDYRSGRSRAAADRPAPVGADGANPAADAEALAKLRALGYLGAGESTAAARGSQNTGSTRTAGSFNNEGLILREQGKTAEAIAAFERAIDVDPRLASALWNLSDLLFAEKRDLDRADDLLLRALAQGLPGGVSQVVGRAIAYRGSGQADRSLNLLAGSLVARPDQAELWLFRGRERVERGECARALEDFQRAKRLDPGNALAYASSGLARLCLEDRAAAAREFRRSLQIDPDQPELRRYLEP